MKTLDSHQKQILAVLFLLLCLAAGTREILRIEAQNPTVSGVHAS